jgi:hypothetical protein
LIPALPSAVTRPVSESPPPGSRPAFSSGAFPYLAAALAAVLCLFVNRHTLSFPFIPYDEELQILLNGHMGSPSGDRLAWMFLTTGYNGYYMPLCWLFTSLVYTVAGLHPEPYHAVLVGYQALNAVLIYALVRRALPAVAPRRVAAAPAAWVEVAALLGSLWWSLNPFRVETSAWVSGLNFAQAIAFAFGAVIVHLGPGPAPRGWRRPAAATALYAGSMLTYPIALGLAPVFFVLDWFAGRRSRFSDKAGFVAVAAVVLALTLQAERKTEAHFHIVEARLPVSVQAARAAYALSYYAVKPWVPLGLAHVHPETLVPRGLPGIPFRPFWGAWMAGGVAATVLLAVLCGLWPGFRRTLGPFLLCHVLLLAPMLGLTMNGDYIPFDRYCALAGGAWAVGLAVLAAATPPRRRVLATAALGGYLLVLACRSELQTRTWRSWDAVVADISAHVAPDEFPNLQYYNPAQEFKMSGQYDQARAVVARGRRALPDDPALTDLERDIEDCRATYTRFCAFADVHVHLGAWFIRSADWREADEHLRLALELSPGYGEAAYNRALVRLNLGDYQDALHDFLWAEAHVPAPFSAAQRQAVLGWVAREAEAAGDPGLAQAARRGSAPGGG